MKRDPIMNTLRFIEILQSYGASPARWPVSEREAMNAFAGKFSDAQTLLNEQAQLDAVLDLHIAPAPSEFLRARILGAAAKSAAIPKAANDRLPWRSVAAMLMIGIFTGLAAGQFASPAQTDTGAAEMLADNSYSDDYDWLGDTFDIDDTSGG